MSIADEQRYERKIRFFKERLQTCGYRFHNLIQTRRKEIPRLAAENNEAVYQEVEARVLGTTDAFIHCLTGDHYATQIPDYLVEEANTFKTAVYTRLAPRFVLEEDRFQLLEKIFSQVNS